MKQNLLRTPAASVQLYPHRDVWAPSSGLNTHEARIDERIKRMRVHWSGVNVPTEGLQRITCVNNKNLQERNLTTVFSRD